MVARCRSKDNVRTIEYMGGVCYETVYMYICILYSNRLKCLDFRKKLTTPKRNDFLRRMYRVALVQHDPVSNHRPGHESD